MNRIPASVLFVCVENSCRSQIAEAIARRIGKTILDPWSAGSKPSGKVNPLAIEIMKERGIDLGAQTSKGLSDLPKRDWDYVITMGCGDACPNMTAKKRLDWTIPDPKAMPREGFRKVCDEIEEKIRFLVGEVTRAGA